VADSFQLKAIITAVDQLSGPMKGMQRELKGFQKEVAGLALGAAAAGAAILGALAMPINQAMTFESTMADVRKVVDGLDNVTAFRKMSDDILDLSTTLPMTADGIGQIVAAGGQAGIAREDLLQFANDAVKMGVAFDSTAEESGQMMAQWRTAFKLTQGEVVTLADKINYLGNTGPANAQKISDIVTRIGPLGGVAGVASGEIAAMGATIAGMGVESEIASTGIKNFMLSLTAGNSATKAQKRAMAFLKLNPAKLAADMQKDSRSAMLKVLDSLAKVPKEKQAAVMNALFGKESLGAIAPLLTNLDLLRTNFNRVADAQQYGGSMQKEYASRAATTENQLLLLKNSVTAISVTLGDVFLPAINEAATAVMPYLERVRDFVRANPELVKSVAKFGGALLGVGVAIGSMSRAFKILNSVMNLSPAKALIAALAAGAMLIIQNWDQVGPVVKEVWQEVDRVVQSLGGWESTIKGVAAIAGLYIGVRMIANIQSAILMQKKWTTAATGTGNALKALGKISLIAGLVELGLEAQKFEKDHPWLIKNFAADALNSGFGVNDKMDQWGKGLHDWVYNKTGWQLPRGDGYVSPDYAPAVPLRQPVTLDRPATTSRQQGELKVTFENAPQGMRVVDVPRAGDPMMKITHDVGYSPFRNKN
jgi:TP901 family phage tail tape measure protein